jgi:FtsH-binding integral membrane protein
MFNQFAATLKLMQTKKQFLIAVFANLIAQLGITYYVMERTDPNLYKKIGFWTLLFFQLFILYLMITLQVHPVVKFILFAVLSGSMGINLAMYKKTYSEELIRVAIQGALSVFVAMFLFGLALLAFGIYLGPEVGLVLMLSLFGLIIARIISYLSGFRNKTLYIIGVILFSAYVIYDTNVILRRDYYGDFITASLDYYLDILNLYTNILGGQQ